MKAIQTNAIITSIRRKNDRSLGLSISTPEVSNEEAVAFMELQGINLLLVLNPLDIQAEESVEIEKDIDTKSDAQRLRSVLYILWKQNPQGYEDFKSFYHSKMERIIESLKQKIEE